MIRLLYLQAHSLHGRYLARDQSLHCRFMWPSDFHVGFAPIVEDDTAWMEALGENIRHFSDRAKGERAWKNAETMVWLIQRGQEVTSTENLAPTVRDLKRKRKEVILRSRSTVAYHLCAYLSFCCVLQSRTLSSPLLEHSKYHAKPLLPSALYHIFPVYNGSRSTYVSRNKR